MALTTSQLSILIQRELGQTSNPDFAQMMPDLFTLYEDKESIATGLQYLYVKRHAIEYLIGQRFDEVDIRRGDDDQKRSQKVKSLESLLSTVNGRIMMVESRGGTGVVIPTSNLPNSIYPTDSDFPDDLTLVSEFGRH